MNKLDVRRTDWDLGERERDNENENDRERYRRIDLPLFTTNVYSHLL